MRQGGACDQYTHHFKSHSFGRPADNEIILVSLLLLLFWTKGKSYFNDSRDASCMHARVKSNRKWARTSDKIIQPLHMQWPCPFHAFFNPSLIRKQIIKEKCTHTLLTFHFFFGFFDICMVSRYSMNSIKTKSKLKRKVNIRASKKKLQTIYGYVVTHTDADTRLTLSSNGEETNLDCPHMFFFFSFWTKGNV